MSMTCFSAIPHLRHILVLVNAMPLSDIKDAKKNTNDYARASIVPARHV